MANFKNRLHEQLARRTARDAARAAATDAAQLDAECEPCAEQFSGATEEALSAVLLEHYKSTAHRRATNITIDQQRALRAERGQRT